MDHPVYKLPLPEELNIHILSYLDPNVPEYHKLKIKMLSLIDSFTIKQLLLFYYDFMNILPPWLVDPETCSITELRQIIKESFMKRDVEHVHFIMKYMIPNFYEKAKRNIVYHHSKHEIEDRFQQNFKNQLRSSYISRTETVCAFLLSGFEYSDTFVFKAKNKRVGIKAMKALKNVELK
jgi:hypothetical protein